MKNIHRLNDFLEEHSKKKDVCEAFSSFARKSSGVRNDVDELIFLQDEYRKTYHWDNNFHCLIEAGGYLGQKYDDLAKYIFERIISKEEDKTDYKYFLSHCLTVAAKINPRATELLWKLLYSAQILAYGAYGSKGRDYIIRFEGEPYDINSDVSRGIADSRKLFDIVSPDVITFLINKLTVTRLPVMDFWLVRVLGDDPVVSCQILNTDGTYSAISQDFSNQVLPLLRNSNLFGTLSPIGELFSKWCLKAIAYKADVVQVLGDHETHIAFLIDYLEMRIKDLDFEIENPSTRETIKILAERKRKEADVDAEIERMKEEKAFFEKCVSRLENTETREVEFEFQMDVANKIRTEYGRHPEMLEFIDWMKNEILNKTTRYPI